MNSDIRDIANWARSQGWDINDTADGYTRFLDPEGAYICRYPATPSNAFRRMKDLKVALKRAGLPDPATEQERTARNERKG